MFNDNKQQIKGEKRNGEKIHKILSGLWKNNDVYNGKKNEQEHNMFIELSREEKYEQRNNKRKPKKNNSGYFWKSSKQLQSIPLLFP